MVQRAYCHVILRVRSIASVDLHSRSIDTLWSLVYIYPPSHSDLGSATKFCKSHELGDPLVLWRVLVAFAKAAILMQCQGPSWIFALNCSWDRGMLKIITVAPYWYHGLFKKLAFTSLRLFHVKKKDDFFCGMHTHIVVYTCSHRRITFTIWLYCNYIWYISRNIYIYVLYTVVIYIYIYIFIFICIFETNMFFGVTISALLVRSKNSIFPQELLELALRKGFATIWEIGWR